MPYPPTGRVRVRFFYDLSRQLDVSDLRTALYNWLWARHEGGVFCLRVQDSGQPVEDAGSADHLCKTLDWLGLDWDEGPDLQPERLDLYADYARQLAREGPWAGNAALADAPLLQAGGSPAADLVQVVDDHCAGITHVIRDARWQPGTPRQRLLYDALGWESPSYLHLPPIVGSDRAALCLDAEVAYREPGYAGLVVANHLARLGWSPRGKRTLLSLDELAARFDLKRVSHSPVVFDLQHLAWFNCHYLCGLDAEEATALLSPYWREAYGKDDQAAGTALSPSEWRETLALSLREELDSPRQATERARFAFVESKARDRGSQEALAQAYAPQVLRAFVQELSSVAPFHFDTLDAFLRGIRLHFRAALSIRSRDVMYVLRAALTGEQRGPCLAVICQLLGRERCQQRAQKALKSIEAPSR